MDAEALSLPDGVLRRRGLALRGPRTCRTRCAALREMHRVLRPGRTARRGRGQRDRRCCRRRPCGGLVHAWARRGGGSRGRELTAPGFLENLREAEVAPGGHRKRTRITHRSVNVARLVRDAGFADVQTFWAGTRPSWRAPRNSGSCNGPSRPSCGTGCATRARGRGQRIARRGLGRGRAESGPWRPRWSTAMPPCSSRARRGAAAHA